MKGAGANPPKVSASPDTIKKYLSQENGKVSPSKRTGTKSKVPETTPKTGMRRSLAEMIDDSEHEPRLDNHLPTKDEMVEMFARLEESIQGKLVSMHEDMNHVLQIVEEAEEKLDSQAVAMTELKEQL